MMMEATTGAIIYPGFAGKYRIPRPSPVDLCPQAQAVEVAQAEIGQCDLDADGKEKTTDNIHQHERYDKRQMLLHYDLYGIHAAEYRRVGEIAFAQAKDLGTIAFGRVEPSLECRSEFQA